MRPVALVVGQPVHGLLDRLCLELAGDGAAGLGPHDQAGVGEHVEMLHDGGQGDREGAGQFADGDALLLVQAGEQSAPRRVGEGGEGPIEDGALIVNHMVNN